MEVEQLAKRLEWLDEQRLKDKMTISALEEKVQRLEANISPYHQQISDLETDITRVAASLARFDQFDAALAQIRVDFTRTVENSEKGRVDREREQEKIRRVEIEGLNKAIGEVRRGLDPIPEIRKTLQARQEEDFRLGRLIEEVELKVVNTRRSDEEYKRSLRLLEEGLRQDAKRLTDAQGEIAVVRKRVDEQRGKVDLTADNLRKIESRLGDLLSGENERRQAQAVFVEKQTLLQVERERVWKEWLVRFEQVEKNAVGLDGQIQTLETTQRSVRRSQEMLDDVTQRFERRINEITEMQRLTEERFRQEWVTFKADDQKRWTNFTLSQEEQRRDETRVFDKVNDRLQALEDIAQELQELVQQVNEETGRRLQGLLTLAHELVTNYENTFGRQR
jgi:chromosome segregation ATPase